MILLIVLNMILKVAYDDNSEKLITELKEFLVNFPIQHFNYIKVGPYIPKLGGLDSETTNQIMYKVKDDELNDITYRFKHDSKSSI